MGLGSKLNDNEMETECGFAGKVAGEAINNYL